MSIEIDVLNGDAGWAEAEALFDAVWPLHVLKKLPWGDVTFADADLRVLVRDAEGSVVCHVGLFRRVITWNGRKMHAGGIGGVATRADARRRGYATLALSAAIQTLKDERSLDFALLFCEPHNAPFYVARGFKPFDGEIYVEQPGGRVRFVAIAPYVHELRRLPLKGVIDLNGLPW
ncbi:GNAT family N-acetyltransferase [Bradyrhizobium sp. NP1]|jgi:aminoglycoside 2'-N-acetyltransferase I|uniref:GNAT family N-acetyltransferase n=1 Tax=Bradyrhizobium sp. NP1 TaxID=3049772 RepID=UPI0025A575AD|nr:GNAT family N-acetyltransferase [Bradyrhizobium sp. NP1]WJR79402.1 GNAT family N-acetyltransferase [Bradyrhizobium sp. NP1]